MKAELKSLIWGWQCDKQNAGQTLNKYTVVVLLHQATENCLAKQGIISNGFRRAGLYPWDPTAPDVSKLLPGTIFANPDSSEGSNFMSTNPEMSATLPASPGQDICSTPDEHSNSMVTIPEMSTSVQVHNVEDIPSPSAGDANMMATIPELSTSVQVPNDEDIYTPSPPSHQHDTSDQFSLSYGEGDIGFLDDGSSQLELSGNFVDNDSSAFLETPDLIDSSTFSNETPPKSIKCPKCARGIPETVIHIHMSLCSIQAPISSPPPPPKLFTIPELSLKDRQRQLDKFEMLMLSEETSEEFNKLFTERTVNLDEPLFKAWLVLKNASLPTEAQVLEKIIDDHTAKNIPKKKTNRKRQLPEGPARYDPSSSEWEIILLEQAAKKKKVANPKPKKASKKNPSGGRKHKK